MSDNVVRFPARANALQELRGALEILGFEPASPPSDPESDPDPDATIEEAIRMIDALDSRARDTTAAYEALAAQATEDRARIEIYAEELERLLARERTRTGSTRRCHGSVFSHALTAAIAICTYAALQALLG